MNQDTIVKFIKSEVSRYDDEIRSNAQARLLAQHRSLVTSAGVEWLSDVTPEYNRSEASLISERWKYRKEGEDIPEPLPVDEGLDLRVREASEILTRLGEATEVDYDYVESLLKPLNGQSEFRYWIARAIAPSPEVLEGDPAPAPVPVFAQPSATSRPAVPLAPRVAPALAPLSRVGAIASRPVVAVAVEEEPVAAIVEAVVEAEPVVAVVTAPVGRAAPAPREVVPITTRIATASRPVVEEHVFIVESDE